MTDDEAKSYQLRGMLDTQWFINQLSEGHSGTYLYWGVKWYHKFGSHWCQCAKLRKINQPILGFDQQRYKSWWEADIERYNRAYEFSLKLPFRWMRSLVYWLCDKCLFVLPRRYTVDPS